MAIKPATESATATEGTRVSKFFEKYLRHTKDYGTGEAFTFEDWQRDFIDEAFRLDEDGSRLYQRVILGIPARNGKSSVAAGLALYMLMFDEVAQAPEVLVGAGSGDQAGVVFNAAETFIRINPTLRKNLRCLPSRGTIKWVSGKKLGSVKRVNSEAGNLFGKDASFIVFDEVHEADDAVYTALFSRMGSRKEPMMLMISTAGGNKDCLLGKLYEEALNNYELEWKSPYLFVARDKKSRTLVWWYGAPEDADIDDPEVWKGCNPASWITDQKLSELREAYRVNESDFRKYHLNQWASGEGALLPHGVWESCKNRDIGFEDGDDVWLGVDASKNRDHTAVAMVGPEKDGQRPVKAFVFEYDPHGQYLPQQAKEKVQELAAKYNIRSVAFDPHLFGSEANDLSEEGLTMVQLNQATKRMTEATMKFTSLAFEKKLAHDGDTTLAAHIANCQVRENNQGHLTIRKMGNQDKRKIDAAAALIFALSIVEDTPSSFIFIV